MDIENTENMDENYTNNIQEQEQQPFEQESLETKFWEDIAKTCRFMVVCSRKGGGKSHLITNFIAIALMYDLYEEYHLVIPEVHSDYDASNYEFIKNSDKVVLYEKFQPHIISKVKQLSKSKRICFAMDDATNYLFSNKNNADLLHLLSTTRHGKGCQVVICTHALKNILIPAVRGLIDHLFVGAFTNFNLIKTNLYEENCSMSMTLKEFIEQYKQNIIQGEYNFLYMNTRCEIDFHVNQWNLSNFDRKMVQSKGKAKYSKADEDYELRQKYEKRNRELQIKNKIIKKPKENNNILNLKILK